MFGSRLAVRNAMTLICLLGLVLLTVAQWRGAPALAAGTISGTVFQDYNGNGARDTTSTIPNVGSGVTNAAVDRGLAGVTVTAYDSGGAPVGTAVTGAGGSYSLAAGGTGPYRVEFTGLPSGFQPGPVGANNGSTVRFVGDGSSTDVNLGIHLPNEYCQNNPTLVTSCFKVGDQAALPADEAAVISFPYSSGSESGTTIPDYRVPATHALSVPAQVTGAVWGLEHARSRRTIYASAFFKKHVGFGPGADGTFNNADDPGAVYVLDQTTGAVQSIFTVPGTQTNSHDVNDYPKDGFNTGWNATGKTSLGGIALSEDEATLYVMSLENRTLYALNAVTGAVLGQVAVPGTGTSPAAAPPLRAPATRTQCAQDDIRPFAVQQHQGQLYVGITCTAESTPDVDSFTDSNGNGLRDFFPVTEPFVDGDGNGTYNEGDARELWAYIYTVNPATLAFSAAPVLDFSLRYPRGLANGRPDPPASWLPWVPGFRWYVFDAPNQFIYYPQPWLTDITFENGNLLLALRDRTGDTTGYQALADPSRPDTLDSRFTGIGVGDFLKACADGAGGWTLESNGRCGGQGTGPQNRGTGPGGSEFYFDDGYGISGQGFNHDETALGGSTYVPGLPDAVATTFDSFPFNPPFEVFNSGVRWFGNATGAYEKAYVIFDTDGADGRTFGKANGLGDLIVLCDEAPIEIGNRVWRDDNLNGVQDPNEPVLPGVTLELYEGNTLIATAVTDAQGNYIFSAYRTTGDSTTALRYGLALRPNTQYSVRIPNATGVSQQPALAGLLPTLANAGGASGDVRDSDGVQSGALVLANLTTGVVGANNHTYDFGFVAAPTAITLDSFTAERAGAGVVVSWSTSLERDTWGFHLYRSATGGRGDAVLVSDPLILAQGRGGGGASYSFVDASATGGPYAYWLEEHTTAGARTVYGPATTGQLSDGPFKAWLPIVRR